MGNAIHSCIMCIDSNAKNTLWGSNATDKLGESLESLLPQFKLNLANLPLSELPFIPCRTSFIDITLYGDSNSQLALP